jgi:hypothetical protein
MATPIAKLRERLNDPALSGVYRVSDDRDIRAALAAAKQDVAVVKLGRGKDAIVAGIANALEFPDWFGGNWDALEDCLTDLSWREDASRLIFLQGAVPDDDLGILVDVLSSAAEFWRDQRRPFVAVFTDPDKALNLPDLDKAIIG